MASVSVKFTTTDVDQATGEGYYSVRASVVRADGMTNCIFVLQVSSKDTEGNAVATFSHVANPADIALYLDNDSDDRPYYRVADIKLILTSAQWRDSVMETLKSDIKFLVDSINSCADGVNETSTTIVFPEMDQQESSSSSSDSSHTM